MSNLLQVLRAEEQRLGRHLQPPERRALWLSQLIMASSTALGQYAGASASLAACIQPCALCCDEACQPIINAACGCDPHASVLAVFMFGAPREAATSAYTQGMSQVCPCSAQLYGGGIFSLMVISKAEGVAQNDLLGKRHLV